MKGRAMNATAWRRNWRAAIVLAAMSRGGWFTERQLARELGIDMTSLGSLLRDLRALGAVERSPTPLWALA